jgi:hypothetical protein
MRTGVGIGLLLGVLTLAASTKAAPPQAPVQATLDADKLAPGLFTGTVLSVPNRERIFTVNVAYQKLQLKPGQNLAQANQGLQRQYHRIVQLQNQMMRPPSRNHNPTQTMQQLQNAIVQFRIQLARTQANMFQVINATQKVDFQVEENVKVRIKHLPEQFDERGILKKYSGAELVALKGKDKNLPGYESALESLAPGQIVQVRLRTHKKVRPDSASSSSAKDNAKEAEKGKDAAADQEASHEHKLQVGLILILKDSDSLPSSTNATNGKNNK